jgi:hypothetical protein
MKYLLQFLLLTLGFALTSAGLMAWQDVGFRFDPLWPRAGAGGPHPVYLLVLGLAMIPPALWEIFLLERRAADARGPGNAGRPDP